MVPTEVEEVPDGAFDEQQSLESVTFVEGSRLRRIGKRAFCGCRGLRTVCLPEGLEVLDEKCFAYSGLEEVTVPASVREIGREVFLGCKRLREARVASAAASRALERTLP